MAQKILLIILSITTITTDLAYTKPNNKEINMKKITQKAGRTQLGNFAPEFAHYNDDILFGENWNNTNIDIKNTFNNNSSFTYISRYYR